MSLPRLAGRPVRAGHPAAAAAAAAAVSLPAVEGGQQGCRQPAAAAAAVSLPAVEGGQQGGRQQQQQRRRRQSGRVAVVAGAETLLATVVEFGAFGSRAIGTASHGDLSVGKDILATALVIRIGTEHLVLGQ